jgi:hypothetical protein
VEPYPEGVARKVYFALALSVAVLTSITLVRGRWYYSHGQLIAGPVSLIDLQQMIEQGTLSTSHLVLAPGAADWSEAGDSQALLFSSVPRESTAGHNAKTGQPPWSTNL